MCASGLAVGACGDALIFSNPVVCGHSLCVWVIPPAARPLVDAALIFQETRPKPATKLLVGGLGSYGQRLRTTITAAGLTVPARHIWNHGWMWRTGMLWRGEHPRPQRKRKSHRRNQPPPVTFQRTISDSHLVPIEELGSSSTAHPRARPSAAAPHHPRDTVSQ
ncbi:hypothetical protein ACFYT3_31745 [Nocardia amikacinitolerans]|uniref:hypothetical protein n=1 Tax=Nocardia amikacinitolerans TaxID=756689 RepID=UPI0036A4ED4C